MFNPIEASENIKNEFTSYIATSFHLADQEYNEQFIHELDRKGAVAKGPYLDLGDAFESGHSIESLIQSGDACPLFSELEGHIDDGQKEIKIKRPLYLHQVQPRCQCTASPCSRYTQAAYIRLVSSSRHHLTQHT